MNLLFVTERFPPEIGGVATSASRIARALSRLGHRVDVFTLARDLPAGAADSQELSPQLAVHRLGMARHPDFTLQQSLTFLEWLCGKRAFDAVWGHYVSTAGFLGTWFGALQQLPVILSVRGNDLDRELFPPGDFARLEWCLRRSQLVAAVSRDLARKVEVLSGRSAMVLPNAVDPTVFQPGPRSAALADRYALAPDETVLGFSGELRAKKGLPFLLLAFRELLERQPARLLLIGEVRNQDRGEFERLTVDSAVRDRLIVTGHLANPAEVAEHVRLADVMLFPSLWEGMPNSLLEAMACGVPVIASDAGAIPEIIVDGVNGMLLPRTHLHLMAQRIDELLAMPGDSRQTRVEAARQTILQHYSPEAEAQRLEALLNQLGSATGSR